MLTYGKSLKMVPHGVSQRLPRRRETRGNRRWETGARADASHDWRMAEGRDGSGCSGRRHRVSFRRRRDLGAAHSLSRGRSPSSSTPSPPRSERRGRRPAVGHERGHRPGCGLVAKSGGNPAGSVADMRGKRDPGGSPVSMGRRRIGQPVSDETEGRLRAPVDGRPREVGRSTG